MSFQRPIIAVAAFAVIYAAVSLSITNSYYQLIMTLVLVWAIFGLSWNLLSGYTGLISFGHAAFFGIGAYTTALGQIYFDLSPWLSIPIAAMLGGVAGLLVGFPTFRLQGHYFALAMLAYPLAILYVFEWLGFQEVTLPIKRDNPIAYMQFSDPRLYTLLALAMLIGTILLTRAVERSRFGMALLAIKQNQAAAEAAGINTLAWKLRAISLSGAIAGAVGAFYAVVLLVVTPQSVFGMLVSAQALTVAMFGGVGTVWGPVIGSVILIPLAEILNAEAGTRFPGIQGVIFGLAIISVILLAPEGLFWKVRDIWRRRQLSQPSSEPPEASATATVTQLPVQTRRDRPAAPEDIILEVRNLSRSFGGLKAVQNVSFKLQRNEILGIIGPNGAGKTTLFNLLNGFLRPDTGEVLLEGRDVFARKPHELCKAGVARTFQIMRPFQRMSISDNVVVGAYVRAKTDTEARALAADAIARVGLSSIADRIAGELSTKELRLMELARALAGQPKILLLDETLAGLGHDEADEVVAVIQRLARDNITIAIIEHTMQAMVRLVDNFLVLDHGAVLLEGKPETVTRDTRVIEAYLGKNGWLMLRIEGLSTGYSARPVLSGVSINVEAGQFVAIVGPNGAGKTTLFKTISGILRPSAGTITFEGHDLLSTPPARRPHLGIAHVPEGRQVFPSLTVMENLEMGAVTEAGRRDWKSNIERIFEWLPVLAERRAQFAGTLSGGQQQMLAIGRGLASSPKLLMLDEPSMGLAPTTADLIFDRLIEIRRQTKLTILLVEQRVAEALESADHGYVLEAGRVALEGDKQTLRADDRVRRAYLGM